jgi:hypothetical protein
MLSQQAQAALGEVDREKNGLPVRNFADSSPPCIEPHDPMGFAALNPSYDYYDYDGCLQD